MTTKKSKTTTTIYDIAREARVAPGTVSRTLNNIGYIKDETRQRIEKVMQELKYIPNRAARTLKTKKTNLIMLAIPDTDNPFYVDMIKAVQDVAKYNGYSMVLYYTEGKKSDEVKVLRLLHENFADGLILVNFSFTKEHLKEIERINCPLVLSSICVSGLGGGENDRFDYIGVDTRKGMYLATRHLIAQGHSNIGYIGGLKDIEVFMERYEGYCSAMSDSGLGIKEELIFWKNYSESTGYDAGKHFLSLGERPTAVCAANDMLAMGALRAFEENGIKVPGDISLVGMDNIEIASRIKPKLTTVFLAQSEIGRSAAELVLNRLKGEEQGPSKKIIFEPRLIVRDSSVMYR